MNRCSCTVFCQTSQLRPCVLPQAGMARIVRGQFVGQRNRDQNPWLPLEHARQPRTLPDRYPAEPCQARHRSDDQQAPDVGPAIVTRPRRCFPPVELCQRTKPSPAAKSRPQRKLSIAGAKASMAGAVIGPTPGIAWSRHADSVSSALDLMRFMSASNRAVFSAIWRSRP